MYSLYLVVLYYCHFIWFYLTCLNEINGDGDVVLDSDCVRYGTYLKFNSLCSL